MLKRLAEETGGEAFFPGQPGAVVSVCEGIAHDIRNQYTIGYVSTNTTPKSVYRPIRVIARSPDHGRLFVRTRAGYLIGWIAGGWRIESTTRLTLPILAPIDGRWFAVLRAWFNRYPASRGLVLVAMVSIAGGALGVWLFLGKLNYGPGGFLGLLRPIHHAADSGAVISQSQRSHMTPEVNDLSRLTLVRENP